MTKLFAPLITPFSHDESIDFQALERNLSRYEDAPLDGYLINGSSGEAEMLTPLERIDVLRKVCSLTTRPVLAGLAATSLLDAYRQVDALDDTKLEAILVRTPSYFGRQLDQVEFFTGLAQYSPYPLLVYQIPQLTGVRLRGEELLAISQHPNVVGVKDSLGDLGMLAGQSWPSHFEYFLGAAGLIQPGIAAGAHGGILALANVVPELCRKLLDLSSDQSRILEARELQRRLVPLATMLGGSNGFGLAGLKAACELRGFEAGHPRRPLKRLSANEKGQLQATLFHLVGGSGPT